MPSMPSSRPLTVPRKSASRSQSWNARRGSSRHLTLALNYAKEANKDEKRSNPRPNLNVGNKQTKVFSLVFTSFQNLYSNDQMTKRKACISFILFIYFLFLNFSFQLYLLNVCRLYFMNFVAGQSYLSSCCDDPQSNLCRPKIPVQPT
jgi:hypothetical protein